MAGFRLVTNLDGNRVYDIAQKVAERMDFSTEPTGEFAFRAQKGSFAASIALGAFIAYCNFEVRLYTRGNQVEMILEWSRPWWTGAIGVNRVKNRARELFDAIQGALTQSGGSVQEGKEL